MTGDPGPPAPPGTSLATALRRDRLRGRAVWIELVLAVTRERARERERPRHAASVSLGRIVDDLEAELESVRAELPLPGWW